MVKGLFWRQLPTFALRDARRYVGEARAVLLIPLHRPPLGLEGEGAAAVSRSRPRQGEQGGVGVGAAAGPLHVCEGFRVQVPAEAADLGGVSGRQL